MSRRPFIGQGSAGHLIRVVNRAAASFDVAALSIEEVIELYELLERCMDTLWHEHERVLIPLYEGLHRPGRDPEGGN